MSIRILCFGDSLTWGYNPKTRTRFSEDERWTGVLQKELGNNYFIIEEGQNARTIATDDPCEGEKNGIKYIIPCIESHNPIDYIIIMLGSNDTKCKFNYSAMDIAGEMQIFLEKIIAYNQFRMKNSMKIILVSPPHLGENLKDSWLYEIFGDKAIEVVKQLANWYKMLSEMYNCFFLDASKIVVASEEDKVHLDAKNQQKLGVHIAKFIQNLK